MGAGMPLARLPTVWQRRRDHASLSLRHLPRRLAPCLPACRLPHLDLPV